MKKQLIYSTDSYWYNKFDEEDGLPVYEEYGDKYDDWMAAEDYEAVVNQLDELKFEKYPRREKKEAIILRINAMIVINRKVGARLASVRVCVWLMLIYVIVLLLDN